MLSVGFSTDLAKGCNRVSAPQHRMSNRASGTGSQKSDMSGCAGNTAQNP
jgi:hypothetical protein